MELTRRQETFIRTLVDLYSEQAAPIHYSQLAGRLGVSPFTAYDMLRLLEERGYARSQYQLGEGRGGRSIIIFAPTAKAHDLMAALRADVPEGDWGRVKEILVERIREGRFEDDELALEVLARVPRESEQVLRYCTEVATVLALRLWRAGRWRRARSYLDGALEPAGATVRESLLLLGGYALGALAERSQAEDGTAAGQDAAERGWLEEIAEHTRAYLGYVCDMTPVERTQLATDLNAVLLPLEQRAQHSGDANP